MGCKGKTFQAFNKKTDSWVKYKVSNGRSTILDVKEKNKSVPFKGVKIRGK